MAGELFSVVQPNACEDVLAQLREMAREALRDEGHERSVPPWELESPSRR